YTCRPASYRCRSAALAMDDLPEPESPVSQIVIARCPRSLSRSDADTEPASREMFSDFGVAPVKGGLNWLSGTRSITIPAPTVLLDTGSMRMKLPVPRFCA